MTPLLNYLGSRYFPICLRQLPSQHPLHFTGPSCLSSVLGGSCRRQGDLCVEAAHLALPLLCLEEAADPQILSCTEG